jgi:hypothetical protein
MIPPRAVFTPHAPRFIMQFVRSLIVKLGRSGQAV